MQELAGPDGRAALGASPLLTGLGLFGIAAYIWLLLRALDQWGYDASGALLIAPVLLAVGVPVLIVATAHDDPPLTRLLLIALVTKLAASMVRYHVITGVYNSGDALAYDRKAGELAESFRQGNITLSELVPHASGTEFIDHLTGTIYAVTGTTILGGFLVYSFIGFWGLFLFYRAGLIGLPDLDHRRYAVLLFFLPSLLFWPSSIGKEAWMLLGLGLSAYGAARILTRRPRGYAAFAVGLFATFMVRPHLTLILLAAMTAGFLLRRTGASAPGLSALVKVVGTVALLAALASALSAATQFLKLPTTSDESLGISEVLDETVRRTGQGGSEIEPVRVNSPLDYPQAIVNVLFRPFLWEARSGTAVFAALETTLVLMLFIISWRRVLAVPRVAIRCPYLVFALVFCLLFILAFAAIGNLGIIARQRTQTLPLLLLVLAIPALRSSTAPNQTKAMWAITDRSSRALGSGVSIPTSHHTPEPRTEDGSR